MPKIVVPGSIVHVHSQLSGPYTPPPPQKGPGGWGTWPWKLLGFVLRLLLDQDPAVGTVVATST